jgi:hypothetical protein
MHDREQAGQAASKSLRKLTLSGLKNVTPAGTQRLRKSRPMLVVEAL